MTGEETMCPDCAETIKAAAKVCKHCGYRFPDPTSSAGAEAAAAEPPPAASWDRPPPNQSPGWFDRVFDDGPAARKGCLAVLLLSVGVVVLSLYSCAVKPPAAPDNALESVSTDVQSEKSKAIDVLVDAKENVKSHLKDGDSAQFRSLFVSNSGGALWALCGKVNSKNSFGGYTGFKDFVAFANSEAPVVVEDEPSGMGEDMDRKLFPESRRQFCSKVVDRY